ncbi:thiol reductant ABC exporter subunit CydD [Ancylobacter sp. 6x-1]|uniref:Thiol reductant ABC exporter subunit CydD n=1 Tax=Ancylobacter crimeensis TaxID=2579147 RepID=A0ABT0DB10_9HYPH|nr:thiol reductant ABC exporter subunit CydD [Ancylobacter crimeensis]MCK0197136.1 thiol reductant ABC exporter subunit CydD [Ancylobacter crimeensis]
MMARVKDDAPEQAAIDTGAEPTATRPARKSRREPNSHRRDPLVPGLRAAGMWQVAASLVWVPQAFLLAGAIAGLAAGAGADSVLLPAVGIAVLGVLRAALDGIGARKAFRVARAEVSRLRAAAVERLAARSPIDLERPASGLAASVVAEQAEAMVPWLSRFQPARQRATLVPLAILACVLPLSWAAALVLAVCAPLIPLFMALIGWRAQAASERQLVELGSMNAFLLDRLRGLATIRSLGAVDLTARRLRADAESLRRRTMAVLRIAFMSSAVLELFSAIGVAMVAVYVGFHLLGTLSFGTWGQAFGLREGLFVLLLAPAFFEPLRDLSAAWHDRAAGQAACAALEGLAQGGARMLNVGEAEGVAAPAIAGAPRVRLEHVTFRHAGAKERVLDGIDLTVASGEHVALLAPSGAGKSTILALIAGLAHAESGRVLIGGEPLMQGNAARLRATMGYIGQQPHIFAGTLAGNVTLGRPGIGREAVRRALHAVRLDRVASRRGSAPIGEGGRGLSGGEGMRLALARLAATPALGLILADEPTAHLDSATAREVTSGLLSLAEGRTLLVATHDPALAARMDRVIHLAAMPREDAA